MSAETRKRRAITVMTVGFAIVFFALVMNGGMCKRYENHVRVQEAKKEWLDSQRAESQRRRGVNR